MALGAVLVGVPSLAGLLQLLDAGQRWKGHDETGEAAFLIFIFDGRPLFRSRASLACRIYSRKTFHAPLTMARDGLCIASEGSWVRGEKS